MKPFTTPALRAASLDADTQQAQGTVPTIVEELTERQDESKLPQCAVVDGPYPGQVVLLATGTPEEMLTLFYSIKAHRARARLKRDLFH